MCMPDGVAVPGRNAAVVRVCIVGAGPAGLLSAILLLRRNLDLGYNKYQVTLIDPGVDHGKLTPEGLKRNRSWMIGLSSHGLSAIRTVPGLYEDYIEGLGIHITQVIFGITKTWLRELKADDIFKGENASFTVDRNHICAALGRYLNDHFFEAKGALLTTHYEHKALFVDGQNKQVLMRPTTSCDNPDSSDAALIIPVDYDLLLGCDGIRSVVRNAFLTRHRDFTFDIKGTFGRSKSVHVSLPYGMPEGTFCMLNNPLPTPSISFCLPETNQQLNVALGFRDDQPIPSELLSEDPAVVSAYFKENFTAFALDCDETGRQWVKQGWNTISQVHCNRYHSLEMSALLLGDAAHATSPQIGQGMNTALDDATVLLRLLDEHKDNLEQVLPAFSAERVKEGNALTDLSFYNYSLDPTQQILLMVEQTVRGALYNTLPRGWVDPDPMLEVAISGMKLSKAYEMMCKKGILPWVKKVNDKMMREHFETTCGLRSPAEPESSTALLTKVGYGTSALAVVAAAAYATVQLYSSSSRR